MQLDPIEIEEATQILLRAEKDGIDGWEDWCLRYGIKNLFDKYGPYNIYNILLNVYEEDKSAKIMNFYNQLFVDFYYSYEFRKNSKK